MIFKKYENKILKNNPLKNVICQLKFPNILSINEELPAKFQEEIRDEFPNFQEITEMQNEIVINTNLENNFLRPSFTQQKPIKNFKFSTRDGGTSINLTSSFIALSTLNYSTWEDFCSKLKKIIYLFQDIYRPAYFTRIGLRYIDTFNYFRYSITNETLSEYFNNSVLGLLSDKTISSAVYSMQNSVELHSQEDVAVKILATIAQVIGEEGNSFVLDSDFIFSGQSDINGFEDILNRLHLEASGFLHWAVSKKMEELMEYGEVNGAL